MNGMMKVVLYSLLLVLGGGTAILALPLAKDVAASLV